MFHGLVPAMARRTPGGFFFAIVTWLSELTSIDLLLKKRLQISERAKFENDI